MSKLELQDLLLAAHDLSAAPNNNWSQFKTAFSAFAQAKSLEAIYAPLDNAHVARGHAQALLDLKRMFDELDERVRTIQTSRAKRP